MVEKENKFNFDDFGDIEFLYENNSQLKNYDEEKSHDVLFTDVVLCVYYSSEDSFERVIEGLFADFERTIYSRVNSDSFEVMCKRIFYQNNGVNYSIYGNSKEKFEVG